MTTDYQPREDTRTYFASREAQVADMAKWDCNREVGLRVCAWCKVEMGAAPLLKQGQVTHGICPVCLAKEKANFP